MHRSATGEASSYGHAARTAGRTRYQAQAYTRTSLRSQAPKADKWTHRLLTGTTYQHSDIMSPKASTNESDTNVGFHPPAKTDAPATRSMFFIILLLLVVGAIVAVLAYNHYNTSDNLKPVPEEQAPPLVP